ncbi:MAG: metal ABC transporter permease [Alphaproteobacteria bacterium]
MLTQFFIEPFSYEFMWRGLIASVLIGSLCAVFSCYLILKGWALMGDAVSHAVLPGIALAYAFSVPMVIGAFISGLICGLSSEYISKNSRIKEDAAIGIVFSGLFGLGIILMSKIQSDVHLSHILFGNMLGVSWQDIRQISFIAITALVIVFIKRRDIMLYCFDANHAQVMGLSVRTLYMGLLIFLSLTIVISLKAVGIILVTAMLITPGAISFLLTKSFEKMLVIAMIISISSCVLGLLLSYHFDLDSAALIVLIQAIIFLITFLLTSKRGGKYA